MEIKREKLLTLIIENFRKHLSPIKNPLKLIEENKEKANKD